MHHFDVCWGRQLNEIPPTTGLQQWITTYYRLTTMNYHLLQANNNELPPTTGLQVTTMNYHLLQAYNNELPPTTWLEHAYNNELPPATGLHQWITTYNRLTTMNYHLQQAYNNELPPTTGLQQLITTYNRLTTMNYHLQQVYNNELPPTTGLLCRTVPPQPHQAPRRSCGWYHGRGWRRRLDRSIRCHAWKCRRSVDGCSRRTHQTSSCTPATTTMTLILILTDSEFASL